MQLSRLPLFFPLFAVLLLCGCGEGKTEPTPVLYKITSQRSIPDLSERIAVAAKKHEFGVVTTHDLRAMMKKKGVAFERDVVVLEVCNPNHAKTVLTKDIGISTALPCRISLYREGDLTVLATMSPALMIEMFGREDLREVAATVQNALYAIMAEAAE